MGNVGWRHSEQTSDTKNGSVVGGCCSACDLMVGRVDEAEDATGGEDSVLVRDGRFGDSVPRPTACELSLRASAFRRPEGPAVDSPRFRPADKAGLARSSSRGGNSKVIALSTSLRLSALSRLRLSR